MTTKREIAKAMKAAEQDMKEYDEIFVLPTNDENTLILDLVMDFYEPLAA